jgi:hypothetical protein
MSLCELIQQRLVEVDDEEEMHYKLSTLGIGIGRGKEVLEQLYRGKLFSFSLYFLNIGSFQLTITPFFLQAAFMSEEICAR